MTHDYAYYTPYQYAGCEPIANVDVDGLEPASVVSFASNLANDGINVSMRLLEHGANAGKWAVSYVKDGVCFSKSFKTAATTLSKTRAVGVKVAFKSLAVAVVAFNSSSANHPMTFAKGAAEGAYEWGKEIVTSGIDNMVLSMHLAIDPLRAVQTFKTGLARAKDQIIAKAYKIGSGNFADENEWLVKFANAGAEEHGRLYGKIIPELAIAAVTMGEGTAARAGGRVLSEGVAEVVARGSTSIAEVAVHGNSLKSLKPTWGYKLYSEDGTFLKNGITSKFVPEKRYTKNFMSGKFMERFPFPNRLEAYKWEFEQNQILRGPLNRNSH